MYQKLSSVFPYAQKNIRNCHGIYFENWALSYFSTFNYPEILKYLHDIEEIRRIASETR